MGVFSLPDECSTLLQTASPIREKKQSATAANLPVLPECVNRRMQPAAMALRTQGTVRPRPLGSTAFGVRRPVYVFYPVAKRCLDQRKMRVRTRRKSLTTSVDLHSFQRSASPAAVIQYKHTYIHICPNDQLPRDIRQNSELREQNAVGLHKAVHLYEGNLIHP